MSTYRALCTLLTTIRVDENIQRNLHVSRQCVSSEKEHLALETHAACHVVVDQEIVRLTKMLCACSIILFVRVLPFVHLSV